MNYRKLRIAWSVAWGVAAVLLLVLWVRSYSYFEFCQVPTSSSSSVHLQSAHGRVVFFVLSDFHSLRLGSVPTPHVVLAGELSQPMTGTIISGGVSIVGVSFDPARITVIPFWLVTLGGCILAAAFATVPWLRWRFTIRTLLIATTLVAVVLGLIVHFAR